MLISIPLSLSMVQPTTVLTACQGCHCQDKCVIVLKRFIWQYRRMSYQLWQPRFAKESKCDKELAVVLKSLQHGYWPTDSALDLSPFHKHNTELSILDGCVLWSSRVVIPSPVIAERASHRPFVTILAKTCIVHTSMYIKKTKCKNCF